MSQADFLESMGPVDTRLVRGLVEEILEGGKALSRCGANMVSKR